MSLSTMSDLCNLHNQLNFTSHHLYAVITVMF